MAGNTFGKHFTLTTFGASHGPMIGGVIDGCPAGLEIDEEEVNREMQRRRPGSSSITTQRKEADAVEFVSGIFEGKTTGTPIAFIIRNTNQISRDYEHLKNTYRPSHADFTYEQKYGHRDYRGGGRSSARETACRVVAGAVAKMLLRHEGVNIQAYVSAVGSVALSQNYIELDLSLSESNPVRCPDPAKAEEMKKLIEAIRDEGDSVGGQITGVVTGVPAGWGEPVFDKLHADLGHAMLGINAVKGFEYGMGFGSIAMKGSEHNDIWEQSTDGPRTKTNHSGGIQGGLSNGEDIFFNVAFKPVATIMKDQDTIDKDGQVVTLEGKGRHDPCVVPRAVPIVEAMTALVLVDHMLRNKTAKI